MWEDALRLLQVVGVPFSVRIPDSGSILKVILHNCFVKRVKLVLCRALNDLLIIPSNLLTLFMTLEIWFPKDRLIT